MSSESIWRLLHFFKINLYCVECFRCGCHELLSIIYLTFLLEYNYKLHLGKTELIMNEGRTTYVRQTIYEHTSVDQSVNGRRLLEHLTILKDNLMNILETIVLHFPSDTNRVYFLKLNIIF